MKKLVLSICCLFVIGMSATAQEKCLAEIMFQEAAKKDPSLLIKRQQLEEEAAKFIAEGKNNKVSMAPRIIPVVFHVIHQYGPENISKAQIDDQIRILNEDFRRLNTDASNTPAPFAAKAADCNIEFRLAQLDPNGFCTDGIVRIASPLTDDARDNVKALSWWDNQKYLNIWVVRSIQNTGPSGTILGFAQFPGGAAATDGVVMRSDVIGSIGTASWNNKGRTASHEIGHWLNLRHIWGDANCGNDGVSDTPTHVTSNAGCPSFPYHAANSCGSNADGEMYMNYMDYTDGACQNMFSIGQKAKMDATLAGVRANLVTGTNNMDTGTDGSPAELCAPKADFKADVTSICAGTSVNFTDYSWNGDAANWTWTCTGPATYNAVVKNPSIQFDVPGVYSVSLTAGNATGSDTKTISSYINVRSTVPVYTGPYVEGFESAATMTADWEVVSGAGAKFQRTTTAKYSGSASLYLSNAGSAGGDVDQAISTSIDASALTTPKLYFKTAFAQKNTSNTDALKIYYSKDCGRTWALRNTKSGTALATVPAQTATFVPTLQTQWRADSIQIPAIYATSNFKFKFEFTGGGGNNIYIDDINVKSPGSIITGIQNLNSTGFNFSVFPNPLEENSTIVFNLTQKENVNIKLVDLIGRTVSEIAAGDYSAGDHSIKLDHANLKAGIYFVNMTIDQQRYVQKVIVK